MKFSTQLCVLLGVSGTAIACDDSSSTTSTTTTRGRPNRPTTTASTLRTSTVTKATTTPQVAPATTTSSTSVASAPTASSTPGTGALWQPAQGEKWQIILSEKVSVQKVGDAPIVEMDLVENTNNGGSRATVDNLHAAGKKVICYFSAGTSEDWRPDYKNFKKEDMANNLPEWKGENWLNTNSANVRDIMVKRIKLAADMGCDAIDPDNMDPYNNGGGGFGLKQADAVDYVNFLTGQALIYNMSLGLKNAMEIIPAVLGMIQFGVNEQCAQYKECKTYAPLINAGKAVLHIEYPNEPDVNLTQDEMCKKDPAGFDLTKFSTVQKNMNLGQFVQYCS